MQALSSSSRVLRLEWKTIDEMVNDYDQNRQGVPKFVTRYGDRLYFWPLNTQEEYTAVGINYSAFEALSDLNLTNFLTDSAPDLMLSATMAEACVFTKSPDQAAYWNGRKNTVLNQLQGADERQEYSGTPLTQRPRSSGP